MVAPSPASIARARLSCTLRAATVAATTATGCPPETTENAPGSTVPASASSKLSIACVPAAFTDAPPGCNAGARVSVSSLAIVAVALAETMALPGDGAKSVSAKDSSASTAVSPATSTTIVLTCSPPTKLTVPDGSAPPAKSAAPAGSVPLPVTAHMTLVAPEMSPKRVTEKMKAALPALPSACAAAGPPTDRLNVPARSRSAKRKVSMPRSVSVPAGPDRARTVSTPAMSSATS